MNGRRILLACMCVVLTCVLGADIPTLQLNGKYSKESPHQDDYPYASVDFDRAAANPLGIGIVARVADTAAEYGKLNSILSAHDFKAVQAEFGAKYNKTVTREFDLTDEEKEVVRQHPREFPPSYAETGKRSMTAEILAWAGKELPRGGCSYVGEADLDGSGKKMLVLHYFPPVTYRVHPTLRIFDAAGEAVLNHTFAGLDFDGVAIGDTNDDKRDEIIVKVSGKNEIWVIGVPKTGEKAETLPGGFAPSRGDVLQAAPKSKQLNKSQQLRAPKAPVPGGTVRDGN